MYQCSKINIFLFLKPR